MTVERFQLEVDRWYAWQMLPGYAADGFEPYYSPIKLRRIEPAKTGRSHLGLAFFNAFYASGVQDFRVRLRVLGRYDHHLVAEFDDASERHAIIGRINRTWLARQCPDLVRSHPLPPEELTLSIDRYLNDAFRGA